MICKADLHIHTTLSPCGDIEMTPRFIIDAACKCGYDIIGITDHNTTLQGRQIKKIIGEGKPYILCGAEITSMEEAHCLAFVDGEQNLCKLQQYLENHLVHISNDPDIFGYQLLVDENENVIKEEEYLLINAIDQTVEQISQFVYSLDGIFIPAHIDKTQNSVISQLGFIPGDLRCDALEFSKNCNIQAFLLSNSYIEKRGEAFIRSSDAHYPCDYATTATYFNIKKITFDEIKMALNGENGRFITIENFTRKFI